MEDYTHLGEIGKGSFSTVIKTRQNSTGMPFAAKVLNKRFENIQSLRENAEIQALRRLGGRHDNVIALHDVFFNERTGKVVLIMDYMESSLKMSLVTLRNENKKKMPSDQFRSLSYQLVQGISYLHKSGIFHRDIKPENILICGDSLKIADLGSCKGIHSHGPFTEYISTLWYRAPECMLMAGHYNKAVDIWATGCVLYEMNTLRILFQGKNEMQQLGLIQDALVHGDIYTLIDRASKDQWNRSPKKLSVNLKIKDLVVPGAGPMVVDLLRMMLHPHPFYRCCFDDVTMHAFFRAITPQNIVGSSNEKAADENPDVVTTDHGILTV